MDLLLLVEGGGDGGGGKCGEDVDGEKVGASGGTLELLPRRLQGGGGEREGHRVGGQVPNVRQGLLVAQRPGEAHADALCERTQSDEKLNAVAQRWVVPGRLDGACAHIPTFNDEERRFFRLALARAWGMRAFQQTSTSLFGSAASPGCVCTFRTCKSYYRLENECAELLMLAPAVKALEGFNTREWAARYSSDKVTWPVSGASARAPVRLIGSREEHLAQVRALIEGATTSICVVAGYAHVESPDHSEIILKLLPAAARRGVRVRVLFDALPFKGQHNAATQWGMLAPLLPAQKNRTVVAEYLTELRNEVESCPEGTFRVAFFEARCAEAGYLVKSHVKLFAADGRLAIIGGSNMIPTVMAGKNDCDCLVGGTAASDLSTFFSAMWLEQTGETLPAALPSSTPLPCEQNIVWHDTSAPFATGSSRPSILGDDPILAASVALIDSATEEVCLCYGFSGLMAPLVYALSRASARGVRVRVLLNSHFSCDLRPPMRDLAAGARALLLAAPTAEVYLTGPRQPGDVREEEVEAFVPYYPEPGSDECFRHPFTFVHGKYIVVDRARCSVGSWNAWARSAFHEAELQFYADSSSLGTALAAKWVEAANRHAARVSASDLLPGGIWAPLGCFLCVPFGTFVHDCLADVEAAAVIG